MRARAALMVAAAVVVGLVAQVVTLGRAEAQQVLVWDSIPQVTSYKAPTTVPAPGLVPLPEGWTQTTHVSTACTGLYMPAVGGSAYSIKVGGQLKLRCSIVPTSNFPAVGPGFMVAVVVDAGYSLGAFDVCDSSAGHSPAEGRVAIACSIGYDSNSLIEHVGGRLKLCGWTGTAGGTVHRAWPTPNCDGSWTGIHPFVDVRVVGAGQDYWPPWPSWWFPGATAPPTSVSHSGQLPVVSCRYSMHRDAAGQVYVDLRAQVRNPQQGATDSFVWRAEWEHGSGGRFDEVNGGGEARSYWASVPAMPGRDQQSIPVPPVPTGQKAWIARVEVRRQFQGSMTIGVPEVLHQAPMQHQAGVVIPMPLVPFASYLGFGSDDEEVQELHAYQLADGDLVGDEWRTAWSSVSVYCSVIVDPAKAGGSAGSGGAIVGPGGTGTCVVVTCQPPGETGGGGSGCDWELNPLTWWDSATCTVEEVVGGLGEGLGSILGGLGSLLGPLLEMIGDLLQSLIDLISSLLLPEHLDWEWGSIRSEAEGRAPFAYVPYLVESVESFTAAPAVAGDPGAGGDGDCVEIKATVGGSTHETCAAVQSTPALSQIRTVFAGMVWLGIGVRIVRTAPWAKGKDGGEPGG